VAEQLYSINAGNFVLSSLLNNTNLLYKNSFPLSKEDFKPNLSHKILYISICQLADKGCLVIDAKELITYLEGGYEEQLNALKEDISDGNIIGYIDTLKQLDNTKSYEYWYNEVRKRSLLRKYRDSGFDITEFWDNDKSEEKNTIKLNSVSIDDIVKHFDRIQTTLRNEYIVEENMRRLQAGVGFEQVKENFKNTPYFGACMVSPYQTTLFRGWVKGHLLMNSSPSGHGKAQPIDTIIPTPNGNMRLGDIKVGDYVFDRFGKPTKVLGVYPQGVIDNYKVTLKDGRTTYCNNEHLWNIIKETHDNYHIYTVNTDYIKDWIDNHTINGKRTGSIFIQSCNAVEYPRKDFKINPYVFGSFIGNGCCKEGELTLSSSDIENVEEVAKLIHAKPIKRRNDNYSWNFKILDGYDKEIRIDNENIFNDWYHTKQFFKGYENNILCYSYEKSIPQEYKQASIEQRYELLQGLFDTDGHISVRGNRYNVSYTTTSTRLKNDILDILYSLGYSASVIEDKRSYKYTSGTCYTIHVSLDNEEKSKLFRISRKKNIALEANLYKEKKIRLRHYDRIPIKSVEKMPEPCEMVCIYVDNDEHLYLTNDYIVTHNTIRAVGELCNVCATELWDNETKSWKKNLNRQGAGLYINTELDLELELNPCFVAYISNVPRHKIMDGIYDGDEEERVDKAIQILKESEIFLVDDPNFTLRSIEDNIKYYKDTYNIQYMVFDYIQDNGAIGREMRNTNEVIARDTIILNTASNLKVFAKQYDVGIYTMSQLNGQEKTVETIDEACLSGGRAVKNKLDAGCIGLYPRKKEIKYTEGLLQHWLSEHKRGDFGEDFKPNVVLHNYKVRFSKYGVGIKLYQYLDKGTGRCIDLYCTDMFDNPINIDKTVIDG